MMKEQKMRRVFVIGSIVGIFMSFPLVACAPTANEGESNSEAALTAALEGSETALLALSGSPEGEDSAAEEFAPGGSNDFSLAPSGITASVIVNSPTQGEFASIASAELVAESFCGESFESIGEKDGILKAESSNFEFSLDRQTGKVWLMSKNVSLSSPTTHASKADVEQMALNSLSAVGVSTDEIGEMLVRRLMSQIGNRDGSNVVTAPKAYKVLVQRTISGVEVYGSRLVLSYKLDGTFYKMIGRWPALDRSKPVVEIGVSPAEAAGVVLDRLSETQGYDTHLGIPNFKNVLVPYPGCAGGYCLKLATAASYIPDTGRGHGKIVELIIDYSGGVL